MAGISGQPGTKPSQVESPVPEGSALGSWEPPDIPKGSALDTWSPSGDNVDPSQGLTAPTMHGDTSLDDKIIDYGTRALDYPGGFMRAGLANVAGLVTGQGNIVTETDLANAAKGKGPNSAEYLKRLGVSEGGHMTLPGLGRVTLRGAEGLALDIVTDPLTLIAKAAKEVPYIKNLLNAPGKASEALGEAVYATALQAKNGEKAGKAAKALREFGDNAVAGGNVVFDGAPVGGAEKLNAQIKQAAETMGKLRAGLYDRFTELGGKIDMPKDAFKTTDAMLNKLRGNKNLTPLVDSLETHLNNFKSEGFVTMEQMSQWKTQLYDSLPKAAFQEGGRLSNPGKAFKAALAHDFKNLIVESGNKMEHGLGDAINSVNDKWGALLESSAISGNKGSLGKMIDHAANALAFGTMGLAGLAKKKAFDLATGVHGRTIVGKALMNAGEKAYMNSLTLGKNIEMDRKK